VSSSDTALCFVTNYAYSGAYDVMLSAVIHPTDFSMVQTGLRSPTVVQCSITDNPRCSSRVCESLSKQLQETGFSSS
jgi:hypothetical protein